MSPTIVCSTAEAMPSPARGVTPRWPTSAESTIRNSGSAMSEPSAGTASRRMSRFSVREGVGTLRAYEKVLIRRAGEHILYE